MRAKKIAASLLGLVLAVGVLGACDDGGDDDPDTGTDTTLQMITTTTTG